jgi:UDP-N-acetylglucosamine 4,6-dehydratase
MPSFSELIGGMSRARKRAVLIAYDTAAILLALWAAVSVRLGEFYAPDNAVVVGAALLSVVFGIAGIALLEIYRIALRFFDLGMIGRILLAAVIAAVAWVTIVYFLRPTMIEEGRTIFVPRSIGLIYCGFLFMLMFVGRYCMAAIIDTLEIRDAGEVSGKPRIVAIYGANSTGVALGESVQRQPQYKLAAFIDDDPTLHGQFAAGKRIVSSRDLPALVVDRGIEEIFLAIPNATRAERLAIIARLGGLEVELKTIPAPEEIVSGRYSVSDIRTIDVNDLLRRDSVQPMSEMIRETLAGCSVLVTGAGGSIGSEICRQIVRGAPRKLVLLDHSEFALYTIEQQLIETLKELPADSRPELVPFIGTVLNAPLLKEIIAGENVDTIYHAAAYKHVPLLERNEIAGVENNVFGTLSVVQAAIDAKLTRVTMISTDKAVRPENLMGASKRVAELIVQAFAQKGTATRFGIVRFGNVLDSSGSVVQLFRNQIRRGGPVTVTHPEVTRFFMSIPEATQLVLQASAMAQSGEVFVLDMGEPVRIDDLARNMIRLSGMTVRDDSHPAGDIEIAYVGMRPGEKLYEELFIGGDVVPTAHPRIRKAIERSAPMEELNRHLARLREAIDLRDAASVRQLLKDMIRPDETLVPREGSPAPAAARLRSANAE